MELQVPACQLNVLPKRKVFKILDQCFPSQSFFSKVFRRQFQAKASVEEVQGDQNRIDQEREEEEKEESREKSRTEG